MDKLPALKQHDLGPFQSSADAFKIGVSYMFGLVSLGYCIFVAATKGEASHLQVLVCILGGTIGWILGLYLTPDSESEKKRFSEAIKLIAVLAAGFGLAKAEEFLAWLRPYFMDGSKDLTSLRLLLFFCCLLIGGLFTYISRLHVRDEAEKQRQQREKLLLQVKEVLDKLVEVN
jgi:hypothetical protein